MSAAAALLFAAHPTLTNDQVMEILESSAHDLTPPNASPATTVGPRPADRASGCSTSTPRSRSPTSPPPPDSAGEPNDKPYEATPIRGFEGSIEATVQRGDDPDDIYDLRARKGNRVTITIEPEPSPYGTGTVDAIAWLPGTVNVSKIASRRIVTSTIGDRIARAPVVHGDAERHAGRSRCSPTSGWTAYRLSWSVAPSSSSGGTLRK